MASYVDREHRTGTDYPSGRVGAKGKRGGTQSQAMQALFRSAAETNAENNPGPQRTGGFSGFGDYGGLKTRSNDTYDRENVRLLQDEGSFDNTVALMNNQQSKVSPWAPWFQALADQGVSRVAGGPSEAGSNQVRGFGIDQTVNRGGMTQAPRQSPAQQPMDDGLYAPSVEDARNSARRYMADNPAMSSLKRKRY